MMEWDTVLPFDGFLLLWIRVYVIQFPQKRDPTKMNPLFSPM